ncbi:MAG: hypothetical protein HC904_16690 [Blastochloris sp.]|nr:hypothetical protein [Blastochloris sp.]
MKTSVTLVLIVIAALSPVLASTQESIQARLVRVELDYVAGIASGMTPDHPQIKGLKAEIDALTQQPHIRNEEYLKILNEQKILIQANLAKLNAEGYAADHPKIKAAKAKADAVANLLKQKG